MKIHLVGVGGIAMGNLAAMLRQLGHSVTGSDQALYPPMSTKLKAWGIEAKPYAAKNIGRADLYIIGNALSRGNPEVERILAEGLEYKSMPQALSELVLRGKSVIVVAGTHGKTTTTFLIDHLIAKATGKPPGLFVGGVRADGMDGFRVAPKSPYFVIEGDEYDSAFFDKHSKFLHYRPNYLILTSLEFDHADIFRDDFEYNRTFERLLRLIPSNGLVVASHADKGVRGVLRGYQHAPIKFYAKSEKEFSFLSSPEHYSLIGRHNRWNAQAALTLCRHLGLPEAKLREALRNFPGVLRRQQKRLELAGRTGVGPLVFIEDFAHHPTAVKETIDAVRKAYKGRTIHALFEPRSASSRRAIFQTEYARALARADAVYVSELFDRARIPAKERLNVKTLVHDVSAAVPAYYGAGADQVLAAFRTQFRRSPAGDVVLAMSNGAFGGIYKPLEEFLRSQSDPP